MFLTLAFLQILDLVTELVSVLGLVSFLQILELVGGLRFEEPLPKT